MVRLMYIAALGVLQVMLAWQLIPVIAATLQKHIPLGSVPDGWPAVIQVACTAVCVVGAGLSLAWPSIALMRHSQRGVQRYLGLPAWSVGLTLAGAGLLVAAGVLTALARSSVLGLELRALFAVLPLAPMGIALTSAGVLLGEMLRRSRPVRARSMALHFTHESLTRSPEQRTPLRHAA